MKQQTKVKLWRSHYGLMVLLLVMVSLVLFAAQSPAAAANSAPAETNLINSPASVTAPRMQTGPQSPQACQTNPFGNVHDLFLENEAFVSVTATSGFDPNLNGILMDVTSNQYGSFLAEEWVYYEDSDARGLGLEVHAVTAADLDGNGESEFIQTFTNQNDDWFLAYYDDPTPSYYMVSDRQYNPIAAASGHITSANNMEEQAVLAGVDQVSGKVNVLLWDGSNNNGSIIIQGRWSSTAGGRQNSSLLDIAVGDFNGDTDDEIAVLMKHNDGAMELVVLEYDPNHNQGSGDDIEYYLKPIANQVFNPQVPSSIQVLSGRLNADFREEIIVVFNDIYADDQSILLFAFELDPLNSTLNHLSQFNMNITYQAGYFDMAAGMGEIDGDYLREEIAIAYPADDGFHIQVLGAQGLDTPTPSLGTVYDWSVPDAGITQLSLAVGDLNNDGPMEIVSAYENTSNQLEVIYLDQDNLTNNTLTHSNVLDPNGLNTPTAIAMGDANNDSIRAVYSGDCREVREDNVNSVVYRPPLWQNIQQPNDLFGRGFIGETKSGSTSVAKQLGYERNTATSGYVGVGIEGEYGIASFEASAKFTMAEEYSQGSAQGSEESSSVADSIKHGAGFNFAIVDEETYYCYGYDVIQHGVPLTDTTSLRSCELDVQASRERSATLIARDTLATVGAPSANQALEWVPTTRDWASLALFRENFTNQSSNPGTAGKAVDGNLDGVINSMTSTTVEDYPWWEVDLGQAEEITAIRIWHNDLESCQPSNCAEQLKDFYVFVSNTPFSPTDTPADLLANPDINSYSFANISEPLSTTVGTDFPAGRVTTFITLEPISNTTQPIQGQYIRVQIDRANAQLQLAEVQVFGTDHIEPNRYPLDVRAGGTEYFEVKLYNPYLHQNQWIQVRGELLWNGLKNDGQFVTIPLPIGEADDEWSRIEDQTQTTFSSRTIAEKKSVGVEFDLSAGAIVQAQAGYGMEWSSGVFTETTHTTSWSEGFELGGWLKGFPHGAVPSLYPLCDYSIRPYYYQLTEESSFGYQTTHTVLDYIVTDHLNRTSDLTDCLLGHNYSSASNATPDEAAGTAGGTMIVHALVNDAGTEGLRILSVDDPSNGSVTFTDHIILYTPDAGFIGDDTFSYTIGDGITSSTASVTVTVNPILVFLPAVIH